jgi:hypothetical protein
MAATNMANSTTKTDDSFEIYDLRVEVIAPEGVQPREDGTFICGSKPGDYFTLQGEMLYLPPGQGISIYSLCGFAFSQLPQLLFSFFTD